MIGLIDYLESDAFGAELGRLSGIVSPAMVAVMVVSPAALLPPPLRLALLHAPHRMLICCLGLLDEPIRYEQPARGQRETCCLAE
jgi:hypothetical protein